MTGVISSKCRRGALLIRRELIDLDLSQYQGVHKEFRYHRCSKTLMGVECAVILTLNDATKRKKSTHSDEVLINSKTEMLAKWASYKKSPKILTPGLLTLQTKSKYGTCLTPSVQEGQLHFRR